MIVPSGNNLAVHGVNLFVVGGVVGPAELGSEWLRPPTTNNHTALAPRPQGLMGTEEDYPKFQTSHRIAQHHTYECL